MQQTAQADQFKKSCQSQFLQGLLLCVLLLNLPLTAFSQSSIQLNPSTKDKERSDLAVIKFRSIEGVTQYALDPYREVYQQVKEYNQEYKDPNKEISASAKFMLPGSSDQIFVALEAKEGFDPSKVKFITSAHKEYKGEYDETKKGWTLTLIGSHANDGQDLYVVYEESPGQYATLMKFDTVVANPPFSLDKWGADEAEHDPDNRFWRGTPPKSKGDWAFSHMIEVAYEGRGKVGVVVPHGVLFRGASEGKIRQKTIEENILEAVIGLPANLFFGTGIPAAIVIFNKGKKTDNVLFIDASKEYEAGKNQNKLRIQDIDHIVTTYRNFTDGKFASGIVEDKYAYIATPAEITENDYNLNIPRYVDTFEEEVEIDIPATQAEIEALEKELVEVQTKMNAYLKELGY